jgi:hypothetical protein
MPRMPWPNSASTSIASPVSSKRPCNCYLTYKATVN